MVNTIFVLAFSFTASLGFAVVFNIHSREKLLYAGLGGFITRLVYIILSSFIQQRFIYILIASILTGNIALAQTQGIDCLLSLIAMCLGTIISTKTFQSIRRSTQNQDD